MSVKDAEAQSGSIFAAFARQGQRPVQPSHHLLTNIELRYGLHFITKHSLITTPSACVVKWVIESNHPVNIVNDAELQNMFTVRWPHTVVPSVSTVTQDIHVSFAKCHEKIGKLLKVSAKSQCLPPFQALLINNKEYSGRLHFATDA